MLLFWIKSQSGAAYKSVANKKVCDFVLQSFQLEEISFPHEFACVFNTYSIGAVLLKKC